MCSGSSQMFGKAVYTHPAVGAGGKILDAVLAVDGATGRYPKLKD